MATGKKLNSVCAELDKLYQNFSEAFANGDTQGCAIALSQHFTQIRQAKSRGVLPEAELSQYLSEWKRSISKLSELSPDAAFSCVQAGWNICQWGPEKLSCNDLLVQTVANYLHSFSYPALSRQAANQDFMDPTRSPNNKVVGIETAFTRGEDITPDYAVLYQEIERSFTDRNFEDVENGLCRLFHQLATNAGNYNASCGSQNLSARNYLKRAADRLAKSSLEHAFHLASRCIHAIEDEFIFSEQLHTTIFKFSAPIIEGKENQQNANDATTQSLNLVIMKRASESSDQKNAKDIFDAAAIKYRQYLESFSVEERFDRLWEISEWLSGSEYEESLLGNFVEQMLKTDMQEGKIKPISRMRDHSAKIYEFPSRKP